MAIFGLTTPSALGLPMGNTLLPTAYDVAAARLAGADPSLGLSTPGLAQNALTQAMNLQLVQILGQLMVAKAATNQANSSTPSVAGAGASSPSGGCCGGSGGAGGSSAAANSSGASSASGGTGPAPAASNASSGEVKDFIGKAAEAYGADPKVLSEIARRESNFKPDAVNDWDSNAKKGTPSKGMFQFIEPTFNSMAPKAKAANPKAWEGLGPLNWMDWRQQALTTAWAIKNGQGSHWATYAAAKQSAGSTQTA